ncbi:hypothetical protein RND81_02G105500 [Saponaria officinalis]|uniref:Ferredoxin--NADP reductase, chloroplastic n=1 Tax=Saponaria officinalis TaxID=3572 RepID=A0AAW1MS06_SAPOF
MEHLVVTSPSIVLFVVHDMQISGVLLSRPFVSFLSTSCVSFGSKSWAPAYTLDLANNVRRRNQSVVCLSVQQTATPTVAVTPLHLEDTKEPPLHLYKAKEPYTATIVSVERIVGPKAPGETCPHTRKSPQCASVFITSTRFGDNFDGKTASLCVRRAVYYDPETGKEDPSKNGNMQHCNAKPGRSGKVMLLPEEDPKATHIMIATGTGVAPYRGYLRRMFMENVPTYKFKGLAWLFLEVANTDSLLYDEEFTKYLQDYPDNFQYDKALRREQNNKKGGKMYVQDKIKEYSDEIFKLLDNGAHIYFCGLKGMMPGIQDTLERVAEERGESWDAKLTQLKKNKQWHVQVY